MENDISKILFHETTILSRLDVLANEITEHYKDKEFTVISILNGSFIFMADLLRRIQLPMQMDCWSVSSYHGTKSSGLINFRQSDIADVSNRHVLLLDDILDSGLTLHTIKQKLLQEKNAKSVKSCVLLNKQVKRNADIEADYTGFFIGQEFVVGYGLDYNEKYRNLPFVGILKESIYSEKKP
jgi:hypoxanthine phosphoribosyltransferase